MFKKVIFILFLLSSAAYSQCLKIIPYNDGFAFYVDKRAYTLPEEIITYRVWDENKRCIIGGEMDWSELYEPVNFTGINGKYDIIIYIKPNKTLIRKRIEVKR
jgi:hypothetical protein